MMQTTLNLPCRDANDGDDTRLDAVAWDAGPVKSAAMKSDSADSLPKTLVGVVCQQWVRCGRANCRCQYGKLHGPYFYRFWRQAGRLRKAYVPRADVDRVRAECEARRLLLRKLAGAWQAWRQMVSTVREAEAS